MQIAEAPTGEKRERNCGNLKLYLPYAERFHRPSAERLPLSFFCCLSNFLCFLFRGMLLGSMGFVDYLFMGGFGGGLGVFEAEGWLG